MAASTIIATPSSASPRRGQCVCTFAVQHVYVVISRCGYGLSCHVVLPHNKAGTVRQAGCAVNGSPARRKKTPELGLKVGIAVEAVALHDENTGLCCSRSTDSWRSGVPAGQKAVRAVLSVPLPVAYQENCVPAVWRAVGRHRTPCRPCIRGRSPPSVWPWRRKVHVWPLSRTDMFGIGGRPSRRPHVSEPERATVQSRPGVPGSPA